MFPAGHIETDVPPIRFNWCLKISSGAAARHRSSAGQSSPLVQVQPLGEADRIRALQLRAHHRGLDLPDDTARYLLSRSRRDMASLYRLLDKLDSEALRAQRRLTIPFVKEVL